MATITKTISFTVADSFETLPGANIAINGIGVAQTDIDGRVTLANLALGSMLKITYVGYQDYIIAAANVPAKVIMVPDAIQLPEVIIVNNYKKPVIEETPPAASSNTWLWLLAGGLAAIGIVKYSKSGTKIVKAKI